jgi:hypothetical protein
MDLVDTTMLGNNGRNDWNLKGSGSSNDVVGFEDTSRCFDTKTGPTDIPCTALTSTPQRMGAAINSAYATK